MRVSRAQADANREHIIETAGMLFREKGFDGIGVNDLMKAAGLTRGGFYGHFESKQDLIAQACRKALLGNLQFWRRQVSQPSGLKNLVSQYLSEPHRKNPAQGCTLASLAAESTRQAPAVKAEFSRGLEDFLAVLEQQSQLDDQPQRRQQAMAQLALMVGAQVLARAVDDDTLSAELLQASASAVLDGLPSGVRPSE